jgi:hypothetical protein
VPLGTCPPQIEVLARPLSLLVHCRSLAMVLHVNNMLRIGSAGFDYRPLRLRRGGGNGGLELVARSPALTQRRAVEGASKANSAAVQDTCTGGIRAQGKDRTLTTRRGTGLSRTRSKPAGPHLKWLWVGKVSVAVAALIVEEVGAGLAGRWAMSRPVLGEVDPLGEGGLQIAATWAANCQDLWIRRVACSAAVFPTCSLKGFAGGSVGRA